MKIPCFNGFIVLSFILFVATSTSAQERELSRAKISFSETIWDFGYVPKGGKVSHTYQIKNLGEDTLIIAKVRTTCGCTTVPLPKQRIAPNETADMKAIFSPGKIKVGETTKKLRVVSNDPINPFAEVQFTAKIGLTNSLVKITPLEITFDSISREAEAEKYVTIENISGDKLSVKLIEGPGDYVEMDLKNDYLNPEQIIQIPLRLKKEATLGQLNTSVTLDFESSRIVRVSIPISAEIIPK